MFWSKSLLNTKKKRACFLCFPRACYLYIFHTPAFECPSMLVTPCLKSKAAINHISRPHYTEITESRDLIPNYTPWWGAVFSMHDSLLETIDREAFLFVWIMSQNRAFFLTFSTFSSPFKWGIARKLGACLRHLTLGGGHLFFIL